MGSLKIRQKPAPANPGYVLTEQERAAIGAAHQTVLNAAQHFQGAFGFLVSSRGLPPGTTLSPDFTRLLPPEAKK